MLRKKLTPLMSVLIIFWMLVGVIPTYAFEDENAPVSGFTYVESPYTVTEKKYFMFAEYPVLFPLSEGVLGEGTYGTEYFPMIPDGRGFTFDFLVEQSQDIRLELWSAVDGVTPDEPQAGQYLGLIASGYAEGQWGDLGGDQWYNNQDQNGQEKPVANRLIWDGLYWDNIQQAFIRPGVDAPDWNGVQTEFSFIVRFQPTSDNTAQFTTDLPIRVDYSDDAVAKNAALRSMMENGEAYEGDPVFMPTGNFLWDYRDLAVNGAQSLKFTRHYNAHDKRDGELGVGWRHNYSYSVEVGSLFATVNLADGTTVSYTKNRDGSFSGSPSIPYTLEPISSGYLFTMLNKTRYFFDTDGRLTSIIDVNGNTTTIIRNDEQLQSVSNSSGTLTFSYTSDKISGITDQTGRSVQYTYNGNDLVSFLNPDGDTIDYTYDGAHHITAISDLNGNIYLTNTYDDIGRVVEQYVADQGTTYYNYDFENRVTTVTDPFGAITKYYYDTNLKTIAYEDVAGQKRYEYTDGRMTSMSDRLGNITSYSYDAAGNLASVNYPDGKSEYYTYNDLNLVTRKIQRDGTTISMSYDERGNMTSYTDANNQISYFTYDTHNNRLTSTDALGNTTAYTYDDKGNVMTLIDPLGNVTEFAYDGQGRLVQQSNIDSGTVVYTYTATGKIIKKTDPYGHAETVSVNGNGFKEGITDRLGYSASTVYNAQNMPVSVTDALGNTTTYTYDIAGQLIMVTDALGGQVSYGYDLAGRMVSMTDARGNTSTYSYDAEGRMTRETDQLNHSVSTVYDNMGRVISDTNQRGYTTSYSYDDMGRVTTITDALGKSFLYVYDANGNVITQYDKNGNMWSYTYDANNQTISAQDPLGYVTSYTYDANGNTTKTVSALDAQTQFYYDSMGRLIKTEDAKHNETTYSYDMLGRLLKTTFADGTFVENLYNKNGWLVKTIAQDGGETNYTYNGNGQILTITDALGGTITYTYDALGRILSEQDALGGTSVNSYDPNGNLLSFTDALGHMTSYVYDALGRVTQITDPNGGVILTEYDENGNVRKVINPDGGTIVYSYDELDRLTSIVDPEGYTWSYTYDANDNITSMVDGRGNTRTAAYDALNRAVSTTDSLGGIVSTTYDADGRIIKVRNAEGAETFYEYDQNDNVTRITDALGHVTLLTYDRMNRVSAMKDARGAVISYTYTATGNTSTVTDALGGVTIYNYDLLGRLVQETNALGNITTYTYDALGRVVAETDSLGNARTFTYDAMSRVATVTDKNGNVTTYHYDANGNVIETIDALNHSSFFTYDAMNRLINVTLWRDDAQDNVQEQQVTLYQYDHRGLVTKEINAAGSERIYVYDGNGNLVQMTDEDGYVTEYAYDARDLVDQINYSGGKEVQFAYNNNGELIAMMDWNGTVNFAVDVLGRITSVNDQNEEVTSYTYDSVGNQTSITYPDGTKAMYNYDLLGRLTTLKDAENQNTVYAYDAVSQLLSQVYPNGWQETRQYDAVGQLLRQVSTDPTQTASKTITHTYTYDAQGNMLTEYRSGAGGQEQFNLNHTYDALNQLISTTGNQGYKAHTYTYDSLGNLTYEQIANKGTDYKYNNLNQMVSKTADGKDTYQYTYDLRGNLTKGVDTKKNTVVESYVYDATNRMVKGVNEAGESSFYIYNGLGYLVSNEWVIKKNSYGYTGLSVTPSEQVDGIVVVDRHANSTGQGHINPVGKGHTIGGTTGGYTPKVDNKKFQVVHKNYVLDYTSEFKDVIMEKESGVGGLTYRYVYGLDKVETVIYDIQNGAGSVMQYAYDDVSLETLIGEEAGQTVHKNGIVKFYNHQDYLGSTDYLTDNVNGKVVSYVTYDDWGAPTAKAVLKSGVRELDLVQSYTGHPYDMVLGIYFAEARMYDAADRRFMSKDSYRGKLYNPLSLNVYVYVLNNPLLYIDPDGYEPVLIGHVYIIEGTYKGDASIYVGSTAQDIKKRMGNHQWKEVVKGPNTTVSVVEVKAELDIDASGRGTLLSARNEALRSAEQQILDEINKNKADQILNKANAATKENTPIWEARHAVEFDASAKKIALKGGNRVNSSLGILDIYNTYMDITKSGYEWAPYYMQDQGGVFKITVESGLFKTKYYKTYVSGPDDGIMVRIDKDEFNFWKAEGQALWGYLDFWGNFQPGLFNPVLPGPDYI